MAEGTGQFCLTEGVRLLSVLIVFIFFAEAAIMLALQFFTVNNPLLESVIDGGLLTLIMFPVLYLLVVRRLVQESETLAVAERSLRESHTRLKTKSNQLEQALAKEKEMNELQRQFVSTMSHEFRTPLAVIDSSVQRLIRRKDQMMADDLEDRGKRIRCAVKTMTTLMESTLSAARMDAGNIEINVAECDLLGIVLDVCVWQLELNEDHRIGCDLNDLPDSIAGDSTALEQIFTNLLSNAVKYSPDGPDITVKGWREGDDAVVSIQDHGLGIDEDELPQIFSRFFRARTSTGISGTGIGLSLVKALVELHGGSISVESRNGEGSTFTVCLPVAGPARMNEDSTRAA